LRLLEKIFNPSNHDREETHIGNHPDAGFGWLAGHAPGLAGDLGGAA
jgi:hypothetical protein